LSYIFSKIREGFKKRRGKRKKGMEVSDLPWDNFPLKNAKMLKLL